MNEVIRTESFKFLMKPYTLRKYDDSWIKINMGKVNNLFRLNLNDSRIQLQTEPEENNFFLTGMNG